MTNQEVQHNLAVAGQDGIRHHFQTNESEVLIIQMEHHDAMSSQRPSTHDHDDRMQRVQCAQGVVIIQENYKMTPIQNSSNITSLEIHIL